METLNQQESSTKTTNIIIVANKKSVGTAFLLAFLLGPLGLLYASIIGGVVMFLFAIISFFILPFIGPIFVWVGCIIWAIISAQNANKINVQ